MLGKIKDLIGGKKPVELEDIDSADEIFHEKRDEKLQSIEEKSSELKKESEQLISQLGEVLEELEDFEDSKQRNVIQDVVENIVEDRKKLVDSYSASEDPEELRSQVEDFLDQFRSMSRKEAAVMEEAYLKDEFSDELGELETLKSEVEDFLEEENVTKNRLHEIKNDLQRKQELAEELEELEERLEDIDKSSLENRIEEKQEKLDEIANSKLYDDYTDILQDLEEMKEERKSLEKDLGKAIGRMGRGLKKLLYESSITGLSKEGSEILRELRDGKKEEVLKHDASEVEKAIEAIRDSLGEDTLEESTRKNLLQGCEKLEDISEHKEQIEEKEKRIKQLEDRKEEHEYIEKKESLEKEKKNLDTKLKELEAREKDLEERKKKLEEEIESLNEEIKSTMRSEFGERLEIKKG